MKRNILLLGAVVVAAVVHGGCSDSGSNGTDGVVIPGGLGGNTGADSGVPGECGADEISCNGVCVTPATDIDNCGTCGTQCDPGRTCDSGLCVCMSGLEDCAGQCTDLQTDPNNCGACGTVCGPQQGCFSGSCTCPSGYTNCNNECVDLMSSVSNCGSCGAACPAGQVCSLGACALTCAAGLTNCSGACVNVLTDIYNCGSCGTACGSGQSCVSGMCSCPAGQTNCSGACVNLLTDIYNCGGCSIVCPAGQSCVSGMCTGGGTGGSTGVGGGVGTGGLQGVGGGGVGTGGLQGVGGGGVGTGGLQGVGGGGVGTGGLQGVGGAGTGGVGTGGVGTGGVQGVGGDGTGGVATTGGSPGVGGAPVGDPPGFVRYNEWFGCSWTGIDDTEVGTTISPSDFTDRASGDPFCVTGTVGPHENYESVALLGFNIQEPPETADCTAQDVDMNSEGPPGIVPTGTGVAFNFVKTTARIFRVQIQGPNGHRDPDDRWCYNIEELQGPAFAPYDEFNTECWEGGDGTNWSGQPISAVVFMVPGSTQEEPFDFCVDGFADGNSAADAPPSGMDAPLMTGTIGGTDAGNTTDPDYERVKIIGDDGNEYIIQNNNWGVADQSEQTIHYEGNSFTIASSTGWSTGEGVPASFPSCYIGLNGNVNDGLITDSGLPAQVSSIGSIPTELSWSGGGGGDYNVSYDVWFASSAPSPGSYDDAISGFVMVWLYKPGGRQPIGSVQRQATIDGITFDVWVGPRGGSGSNSNAPVVSYVAIPTQQSMSFDLMDFIRDAEQHGISSSWYLTDVFGGFEIWTGSDAVGLSLDRFVAEIN